MRAAVVRLMIGAGFGLAAVSFVFALPLRPIVAPVLGPLPGFQVGTGQIVYLPAFFILGIMLMFLSAVAYELLPERSRRA